MADTVHWNRTISDVNDAVLIGIDKPARTYYIALAFAILNMLIGLTAWIWMVNVGVGVTGLNSPVYWGVMITNFVFWVGIGHAGTLISAILFLFRAKWRNSINRSAEAMTVFAVITAGLFPLMHVGRLWFAAYWMMPFPNTNNLWVNFRSPLLWDVFAISTYLTVSLLFWYMGLVPDLAAVRDRVKGFRRLVYGLMSFGWTGTVRQWHHYETGYALLAALATPLVLSVHSIVSWDFAMSMQPGWHTTIFPPYFVAGAILSGCAMVYTLVVPMRKMFQLEEFIRPEHLDALIKLTLLTSTIVAYAYGVEFFVAWYSGNTYEWAIFHKRATGNYAFYFWVMVFCNCVFPIAYWSKRVRNNIPVALFIAVLVNVGMWFERYNIIVSSLVEDFLPGSWGHYQPSYFEIAFTLGSFGWFFMWLLIFARFFPLVSMSELKLIMPKPLRKQAHASSNLKEGEAHG
jgi:Ni/Fe-hydrogenase subunit HybB-like protein